MALDVIIHHQPSMDYATVGHSFFTPRDSRAIAGGAEVWQGYYQSARPAQGEFVCLLFIIYFLILIFCLLSC